MNTDLQARYTGNSIMGMIQIVIVQHTGRFSRWGIEEKKEDVLFEMPFQNLSRYQQKQVGKKLLNLYVSANKVAEWMAV